MFPKSRTNISPWTSLECLNDLTILSVIRVLGLIWFPGKYLLTAWDWIGNESCFLSIFFLWNFIGKLTLALWLILWILLISWSLKKWCRLRLKWRKLKLKWSLPFSWNASSFLGSPFEGLDDRKAVTTMTLKIWVHNENSDFMFWKEWLETASYCSLYCSFLDIFIAFLLLRLE